ncbi:hypothetical protein T03_16092, partial [Trichinella britovi]
LLVLGTLLDSWGGAHLSLEKHFFSSCGLSLSGNPLLESSLANRVLSEESLDSLNANVLDF